MKIVEEFHERVKLMFNRDTLPIHTDLILDKGEIVYTVIKEDDNKYKLINFLIREDKMYIVNAEVKEL